MAVKDVLSRLPGGRSRQSPAHRGAATPTTGGTSTGTDGTPRTTPGDQPQSPAPTVDRTQVGDQGRSAPVTVNAATGEQVLRIHRIGACTVAAVIAVFGVLGFVGGLDFFDTEGQRVLGLSSNGLLSTISIVTAVVLVAAAVRGGRTASTVMFGVGVLFLLSAFWHLFVLNTSINILAFSMPNVVFSAVAGLVLIILGAFGRVSGNIPRENPYYQQAHAGDQLDDDDRPEEPAVTPAELQAERDMREAEIAVAEHRATPEQARRVQAMSTVRTKTERRRVWLDHTSS